MADKRQTRAKRNIAVSLGCQVVTLLCGIVVPRAMIGAFGSEAYGATTSITQFLAYVTLLEGGIGGVARAAFYKPLAQQDMAAISAIMEELKRFFRVIAWIFAGYVLILACSFQAISDVQCLDWISTFLLVVVISISTFGQYFIGISNSVLLQAAQKSYVTNMVSIGATVLNAVSTIVLIDLGWNIILVKLASSIIFFLRPVVLWLYVRRSYPLEKCAAKTKTNYLTQKWNGLSQHIAYFLHSNTDVVVLTCFADLRAVAVYSVYNMIVVHIQNLAVSFTSGMEALFGDMLARNEKDLLDKTFGCYETILSVVSVILFSVTAVLIVPFVKIYTAGVQDADYYAPVFAVLLILASVCYCLRMPYHAVIIAAGHFKQTAVAAYSEAVINIGLSVLLVSKYGLVGVAVGTIAATCFRFVYYGIYLSKHIFSRRIGLFAKRLLVNSAAMAASYLLGNLAISRMEITNYLWWAVSGVFVTAVAASVTGIINWSFFREDCRSVLERFLKRK